MPGLHYDKTRRITPSNAQTALVDLSLGAVALCNEGANSRADIIFTKRKESVSMPTNFEELLKALQPAQADIVTKHIAGVEAAKDAEIGKLNGQIATLTTEKTNLEGQVAELTKNQKPAAEEDVLKSLSPELQALFKKQQETIAGLVADKADELAKSRFEKCKAIPCEEAQLKEVLKSASPAVVSILEAAAAAIEKGLETATGRDTDPAFTGSSATDQYGKLEKSAKEIMLKNAGMTFEKAFAMACDADPDTYKKYVEGVK